CSGKFRAKGPDVAGQHHERIQLWRGHAYFLEQPVIFVHVCTHSFEVESLKLRPSIPYHLVCVLKETAVLFRLLFFPLLHTCYNHLCICNFPRISHDDLHGFAEAHAFHQLRRALSSVPDQAAVCCRRVVDSRWCSVVSLFSLKGYLIYSLV